MEPLGRFRRVLNGKPKANPRPHSKQFPRPTNSRGRSPQEFLAKGLSEDAAKGVPEENPEGAFNIAIYYRGSTLHGSTLDD